MKITKKSIITEVIIVIASTTLLVACGGGGGNSTEPEIINGITVPPDPGSANDETLAGIDSNNNGVRDDVERFIAEEYGDDKDKYDVAVEQAIITNKLFSEGSDSAINEYKNHTSCATDNELDTYSEIDDKYINAKERNLKYNSLFSGRIFRVGGDCE